MIVHFCFKGAKLDVSWPPATLKSLRAESPEYDVRRLTSFIRPHTIAPHDRVYLSHYYDALAYVLENDGRKHSPQIETVDSFAELHNSSLAAAVDRDNVGIYPGLMDDVWQAIFEIVGVGEVAVTAAMRERLVAACSALAWRFAIHEG